MSITVEVRNLGPIGSARIELADLNVLVGANNTGKTFVATVLHRVVAAADASNAPERRDFDYIPSQFRDFMAELLPLASPRDQARLASSFRPDKKTLQWLKENMVGLLEAFGTAIRQGLADAYGTVPSALRRTTSAGPQPGSIIRVTGAHHDKSSSWSVAVRFDPDDGDEDDISRSIEIEPPDAAAWVEQLLDLSNVSFATRFLPPERIGAVPESADITNACWRLLAAAGRSILLAGYPMEAIHLPAERSGIVQNSRVLITRALQQLSRTDSPKRTAPQLTRTTIDLLGYALLTRPSSAEEEPDSEFSVLASSFEQQLGASIELEDDGREIPSIVAVTPEGRFPLARASAMLSEIAPLLLLAKHRLGTEHCLTIDEPEAHLHPELQRSVASFLVQLAKAGTKVVLTTHSNFFVGQLNNHLRAHALAELPEPPGSMPTPAINPADVRALWFARGQAGCVAEPIVIDRIDGVDQSVFTGTMRDLHMETAGTINPLLEAPVD